MAIELYFLIWVVIGLVIGVINFIFSLNLYIDGKEIEGKSRKSTFLVSPMIWALATLFFGIFAVCIYWLIHYSTLKPNFEDNLNK